MQKRFERWGLWDDRKGVVHHRNANLFRAIVAWLILPAWFMISNDCAIAAKPVKSMGDSAFAMARTFDYPAGLIVRPSQLIASHWLPRGTGPPGDDSFAESVLQRSLLAHAPPLS